METFFTVSAILAIVMILGKLAKEYFKWVTKDIGKGVPKKRMGDK